VTNLPTDTELRDKLKSSAKHVDNLFEEMGRESNFNKVKEIQQRLYIAEAYYSGLQRSLHFIALHDQQRYEALIGKTVTLLPEIGGRLAGSEVDAVPVKDIKTLYGVKE